MRRTIAIGGLAASFVTITATPAAAHGIGGRADLPVPVSYFVVGAGVVLVVSFVWLASAWHSPRLQDPVAPRVVGGGAAPARLAQVLGIVGLAGLTLVIAAGVIDGDVTFRNVGPVLVWVYFWLVVPFLSAIFGDLWRWMNPYGTLARWLWGGVPDRPDVTTRWGIWPATVAFVAFTWLELVSADSGDPGSLALAAIFYGLYVLAFTRYAGVETGIRSADAFANYHRILGALAPMAIVERPAIGAQTLVDRPVLVWRGWLRGLPTLPPLRGFAAFVIAMIGTVTYDGMSSTEWWGDLWGRTARREWFGTLALVATVAVLGGAYWVASWVAARLAGRSTMSVGRVAASFAHTLVPIALAYAVAHYFTLVIFEGQSLLHAASDPFGLGWNLFGTATWDVVFWLSPEAVWYIQVAAIILGHVAGVVLAHDRALAVFDDTTAVRTQYAMLVLMVLLTSLGLLILAG